MKRILINLVSCFGMLLLSEAAQADPITLSNGNTIIVTIYPGQVFDVWFQFDTYPTGADSLFVNGGGVGDLNDQKVTLYSNGIYLGYWVGSNSSPVAFFSDYSVGKQTDLSSLFSGGTGLLEYVPDFNGITPALSTYDFTLLAATSNWFYEPYTNYENATIVGYEIVGEPASAFPLLIGLSALLGLRRRTNVA